MAEDRRLFGIRGTGALPHFGPGVWYSTVREGRCRFMAAWVKEDEKASEHQQRKKEAKEADKIEVASGVTVASPRNPQAGSTVPIKKL